MFREDIRPVLYLGKLLFMIYILPLSKVINNLLYIPTYAADIQLYHGLIYLKLKDAIVILDIFTCSIYELNLCARNVRKWIIMNTLFPNSSKTT